LVATVAMLGTLTISAFAQQPIAHPIPPDNPPGDRPHPELTAEPPISITTLTATPSDNLPRYNDNTLYRNEKFTVAVTAISQNPFTLYNKPNSARCMYDLFVTNKTTGAAGPSALNNMEIAVPIPFSGLPPGLWNVTVAPSKTRTKLAAKCIAGGIILPLTVLDQDGPSPAPVPSPTRT
jgi:hypothetical protein